MAKSRRQKKEDDRLVTLEERLQYMVGLVWPDGRVTQHFCLPPELAHKVNGPDNVGINRGDNCMQWFQGKPVLKERLVDKGCQFLKDVCVKDAVPEKYDAWLEFSKTRIKTPPLAVVPRDPKTGKRDMSILYPPTVMSLRRDAKSGVLGGASRMFVAGRGWVSTDDMPASDLKKATTSALDEILGSLKIDVPQEKPAAPKKEAKQKSEKFDGQA